MKECFVTLDLCRLIESCIESATLFFDCILHICTSKLLIFNNVIGRFLLGVIKALSFKRC